MKDNLTKKYLTIAMCFFCAVALAIILYFVLDRFDIINAKFNKIISTLMPFIIGGAIAYILTPMCNTLEKFFVKIFSNIKNEEKKENLAHILSAICGMTVLLFILFIIIIVIVPQLINSVIKVIQVMPESADKVMHWTRKWLASNPSLQEYSQQIIDKSYSYVQNWLSNGLLDFLQNTAVGLSSSVMSVVSVIMNICIGFIVAIYILLARKKLARQANLITYSIFKDKIANIIVEEVRFADKVFSGFINGKLFDAAIVAAICYVGMLCFRLFMPSSNNILSEILIAVIVGVFNIIPFFGCWLGLIIAAIFILMVNPIQCIFFIIFDIVLQQIDANIIGPKILGGSTGLSSFWVLFAILLFGDIMGFFGMLVGVPIFAVIYHIISRLVFKGLKRNGHDDMVQAYEKDYPDKE